jgi:hypothetical protein
MHLNHTVLSTHAESTYVGVSIQNFLVITEVLTTEEIAVGSAIYIHIYHSPVYCFFNNKLLHYDSCVHMGTLKAACISCQSYRYPKFT